MKAPFWSLILVAAAAMACGSQPLDDIYLSGTVHGLANSDTTALSLATVIIENLETGRRDSIFADVAGYWTWTGQTNSLRDHRGSLPADLALAPSYPNPFSETTTIRILNRARQRVYLDVYNILGQRAAELVDELLPPGTYEFVWNGVNRSGAALSPGTYFLRLHSGGQLATQKIVVLGTGSGAPISLHVSMLSEKQFERARDSESKDRPFVLDDFSLRLEIRHAGYDTVVTSFTMQDGQDSSLVTYLHHRIIPPAGMVLVPAGTYNMGANYQAAAQPVHTVNVPAFYLDIYEVTNAEYKIFCDSTNRPYPLDTSSCPMPNCFLDPAYAQCPAVVVTWNDAHDYALWSGKRLPSEAEWECAAKGFADNRNYPWGNTWISTNANIDNNSADGYVFTAPVGTYPGGVSPAGCYDMAGNAWEWCEDDYHDNYNGAPTDGRAWINSPRAPTRSIRGSSWYNTQSWTRCAWRVNNYPTFHCGCIGFRCARTP
jgi:formylglycine-generating enzyme